MTFKIDQCVKEFRSACLTIEHIAHGTDEIYSELRQNRLLSESNLKEIELLERHWKMIRKISERPVIIFVYGQSDEEKLRVLKEVLEVDLQINLNAIRSNNTKAKFVQVNHLADNDDTKIKDLFIQDELASNPQQLTSNALVLLSLHEPDEAFFDRMTNASSDRCSCLWLYTIARGSRTSLLLSGLRPFRNVTNPLLNDFAVVDTMLSFVEVIENSLKAKAMTAILPFKESLTQCLCVVLDILALMSADQRRTHLMLASAQEHENKLFQRLTDLVQRNQSQVAEVVRSAQMTARQNSKRIFQLAREPVSADEIERHVVHELNAVVTKELLKAADVFKQDYIGTLNRCLNDLCADTSKHATTISRSSSFNTNFSVTQAIASMYHIDLDLMSCVNILRYYFEKMKYAISRLISSTKPNQNNINYIEVIDTVMDSISETKLVKTLCRKMSTQLELAHNTFLASVEQLNQVHSSRLGEAEKIQKLLKKEYAPRLALLQLRAMSIVSLVNYGRPRLETELGRGQYGIVYSCAQWGPYTDLALKSVVPVDGRHLRDTALEFYSNTVLPDHPSIVKIYGSVICPYRKSCEQLIIVMDRLYTDLHEAINTGLLLRQRYMIGIEVMEGIRHLHRMGLVHRDIKLRNVLLDRNLHAKITDMGFCKPEVLIDGSVVGTPTHMAPELMTAQYDSTVDIYAFGVLLWHLASNSTDLPKNYAGYKVPSVLWSAVRKGMRPERPKNISDDLWKLIERCWHVESSMRPSAAEILEELEHQYQKLI